MHWIPPTDNFTPLLWAREFDQIFSKYSSADVRQYFADISPTNRVWKNPRSAFKRARNELHNETNDHIDWQIFGGRYCETRRFFTSCLFYSLPYSLFCKSIDFPLPTILPPYSEQENLTKDSLGIQVLMFDSVLPISLQQIEYEKKPRSAFERARKELHNETNLPFHRLISTT